tara:strand:- start:1186 stop:1392 length:207 start_codon:yes stop_codon:yes gene_type:complete
MLVLPEWNVIPVVVLYSGDGYKHTNFHKGCAHLSMRNIGVVNVVGPVARCAYTIAQARAGVKGNSLLF